MSFRPDVKYFGAEKRRNTANAATFERLVRRAFGPGVVILVGHHVVYEFDGVLDTEDEIPSADTVLFDHAIMGEVFGDEAISLMQRIVALKPGEREKAVDEALDALEKAEAAATISAALAVPA